MTNEQAKRLDAAVAKAGLNWWEVQEKIGFENFNNIQEIEKTIEAIEKMGAKEMTTERKMLTSEDAEKAIMIYTTEQWEKDGTFSAEVGQEVSEAVYYQMFNCLPPLRLPKECGYLSGFRVGEPYTHEHSKTTGEYLAHYAGFGKKGGKYYFLGHLNKYGEMCSTDRKKSNAIIYIRGSEEERQYGVCLEYARNNNIKVIDVTSDFGRVAERIVNGEIDIVLVQDFTRITRSSEEYKQREHQLRGYGVTIIAAQ